MTKVTLRKLKTKRYALITKAGVIHYKDEQGEIYQEKDIDKFIELHPNIDIVSLGGGYQGCVDIEKCSENGQEYISLIPYRYIGACYRVSDYKVAAPEKLVRVGLWSKYSYNQFTENISFECRVYKDRKILLLLSIDILEDNKIVDTKTYTLKKPSGELWNIIYFFANQRALPLRLNPNEDDKIYAIENYEDIEESSYFRETQKGRVLCKITSGYRVLGYVNDQYSKIQYDMSPSSPQQFFSEQIVKLFEDFFELKNKDFGINKYFVRGSINSMQDLFVYMTTKDASKVSKRQKSTYGFSDMELINEIYNDIEKNSECFEIISKRTPWLGSNDYYKYDVVVNRINIFGEDIIYICQDPTCSYERWRESHANLLVIFLKGKFSKRLFKVSTGANGNVYKVINFKKTIPTFSTIINAMIPSYRTYEGETIRKNFIYFKTLQEIYSGTLVEKIINNINPETHAYPLIPYTRWEYNKNFGNGELMRFINCISMTESTIAVLLKNSNPIAEQLLNNNLNNILFLFLGETMLERPHGKVFTDTLAEASSHINIKVNPKATGLKKYFNMSMEQLSMVDDVLGKMFETQLVRNFSLNYCNFNLFRISDFINLDKYSSINKETFDKLLNTSTSSKFSRFYEAERGELKALLTPYIQNHKLEQKINIIQELKDSLQEIKDYLSIRRKMVKLQEACPDKKIFTKQDEKRYTEFPTSGKIFIHFFKETEYNQRIPWYVGETGNTPEQHFAARIQNCYSPISMRHVYNDDNTCDELLGVEVDLSRKYMIQFLHDELSKIYSVYVDANKNKLFKEALKRVENLCFVDEEMGLEIITPKDINDLKSEGATLSHCVASYVDPICEGSENILFIRRIDMPYSPYFTMDLVYPGNDYTKPGQVRQIHCYRNGDPTEEGIQKAFFDSNYPVYNKYYDILAFVRKWAEKMNGKLNKNTINAHYGALCAKRD